MAQYRFALPDDKMLIGFYILSTLLFPSFHSVITESMMVHAPTPKFRQQSTVDSNPRIGICSW
jgi:hypothetical protein